MKRAIQIAGYISVVVWVVVLVALFCIASATILLLLASAGYPWIATAYLFISCMLLVVCVLGGQDIIRACLKRIKSDKE